jgi:hypothetical protein
MNPRDENLRNSSSIAKEKGVVVYIYVQADLGRISS